MTIPFSHFIFSVYFAKRQHSLKSTVSSNSTGKALAVLTKVLEHYSALSKTIYSNDKSFLSFKDSVEKGGCIFDTKSVL